ncbi:hypothetical protein A2U01_0074392, partial [Trifolium medium]|nr:hypothetical protein [Trifolium medium]
SIVATMTFRNAHRGHDGSHRGAILCAVHVQV